MAINTLIQSYVADRWFVSTILRASSAMEGGPYFETIVWDWDSETKDRGKLLEIEDSGMSPEHASASHANICQSLIDSVEEDFDLRHCPHCRIPMRGEFDTPCPTCARSFDPDHYQRT